jgi:hypothetical protein
MTQDENFKALGVVLKTETGVEFSSIPFLIQYEKVFSGYACRDGMRNTMLTLSWTMLAYKGVTLERRGWRWHIVVPCQPAGPALYPWCGEGGRRG